MAKTCRLYDKNWDLIAEWPSDENLYFVEDGEDGSRKSGIVTDINFAHSPYL